MLLPCDAYDLREEETDQEEASISCHEAFIEYVPLSATLTAVVFAC